MREPWGGGIAQHIAYGFPCASAVVFVTSFVTNTYYYEQPYEPVIVHLHDRGDELTKLRRTLWGGGIRAIPLLSTRSGPTRTNAARDHAICGGNGRNGDQVSAWLYLSMSDSSNRHQ